MCSPGHHHNCFVAIHVFGYIMYGCHKKLPQSHCGDDQEGTLFSWLHIYYTQIVSFTNKVLDIIYNRAI